MMKKRLLALLMATTMVVSMVPCGISAKAESGEVVEDISFTMRGWGAALDMVEKSVALYNEAHGTNHTVTVEAVEQTVLMDLVIACGESGDYSALPDVMMMEDYRIPLYVNNYPELLADLKDHVDYESLTDLKENLASLNGAKYGIPLDSAAVVGIWDVEALAEGGYTLEDVDGATWERIVEIGADYHEKTGKYLLGARLPFLASMIAFAEANVFNEDGTYNIEGNEVLYQIGDLMKEFRDNNVIYATADWADYTSAISTGKAAGIIEAVWGLNTLKKFEENKGRLNVANMPSLTGDPVASVNGGSSFVVAAKAENAGLIAEILGYSFAGKGMETLVEDFVAIGYLPSYSPIIDAGYFETLDDGFYPAGVWGKAAKAANDVPMFSSSPVFSTVNDAIGVELANIYLEDLDVQSTIDELHSTLDFELQ